MGIDMGQLFLHGGTGWTPLKMEVGKIEKQKVVQAGSLLFLIADLFATPRRMGNI